MLLDQWSLLEENADFVLSEPPGTSGGYSWGAPKPDPPAPLLHIGTIRLDVTFRGSWRVIVPPVEAPAVDVEARRRADDDLTTLLLALLMDDR